MNSKPFVVACIPAFNEVGRIVSVIVRVRRRVDAVVVCDDGSGDLMGEIAETTCFYVSIFMDRYGV